MTIGCVAHATVAMTTRIVANTAASCAMSVSSKKKSSITCALCLAQTRQRKVRPGKAHYLAATRGLTRGQTRQEER